jgi:hypothetical protein
MTALIKAIQEYRPRLIRGKTVKKRELVKLLAARTGFNSSELSGVLEELRDAVLFYSQAGRGVRLEGLGTYLPHIKLDGTLKVSHRLDLFIKKYLNIPGEFTGDIVNRQNIGLSIEELIARWNDEHPDDPIPPNSG